MKTHSLLALAVLGVLAMPAFAEDAAKTTQAKAWPPRIVFANGTELAATGNFHYDYNDYSGQGYGTPATTFVDDDDFRRREFGLTLKRKGYYDFGVAYDFESDTWMDVALRLESKGLFGKDVGKFRIGQFKLPVGFEGYTSTRASSFMENALPSQAFYESRRVGVEWAFERPQYIWNLGYFWGNDLQGNNPGTTVAMRAAWTPHKAAGDVLHLGVSASQENPDSEVNGLGQTILPSVRWRSKPEGSLTTVRLVDSGNLTNVDRIRREGLEALWIKNEWSLQGEYLRQQTTRNAGLPSYSSDGYYLFGSWVVTGESRVYSAGNVSNPVPAHKYGAWEVLARYSHIDLDNDGIAGGRESNWTLGVNAYFSKYLKLQANYVMVDAKRAGLSADPKVLELRAQFYF